MLLSTTMTEVLESILFMLDQDKKKQLEFLLENDAQLKKAIKKDDDESNRCYQADFVENNLNTVRGGALIARLKDLGALSFGGSR